MPDTGETKNQGRATRTRATQARAPAKPPVGGMLRMLPAAAIERSIVRELRVGEAVFRQGDRTFAIFAVEHGRVRLIRHTSATHEIVLHTARAGELFAEAALFAGTYHCDAVAAAASRVRVLHKRDVLTAIRADPAAAERFMAVLAHQIHSLRARLEERNIRSARERVLHHLAAAAGDDGRTAIVDGTLMDLAAEIGLTHEVLYRTLAALQKEGAIVRDASRIVLRH